MAMKLSKAVVVANNLTLAAVIIAAAGCQQHAPPQKNISGRFGVCVPATSISDILVKEAVDFDVGTLSVKGHSVNFYVGSHPDVASALKRKAVGSNGDFQFLGRERIASGAKVLWGHEEPAGRGPIYVMFTTDNNLKKLEDVFTQEGFVENCKSR